jgi:hypothetical protein
MSVLTILQRRFGGYLPIYRHKHGDSEYRADREKVERHFEKVEQL